MFGTAISVVLSVSTSTANWIRPPPSSGIFTSVMPNRVSVLWSTLAFGKAVLMSEIVAPIPTPRAFAPAWMVTRLALRGELFVKSTVPFSGALSRAKRVLGPLSSQPGRSRPTRNCSRSFANVLPSLTWPTPAGVIFLAAAARLESPDAAAGPIARAPSAVAASMVRVRLRGVMRRNLQPETRLATRERALHRRRRDPRADTGARPGGDRAPDRAPHRGGRRPGRGHVDGRDPGLRADPARARRPAAVLGRGARRDLRRGGPADLRAQPAEADLLGRGLARRALRGRWIVRRARALPRRGGPLRCAPGRARHRLRHQRPLRVLL